MRKWEMLEVRGGMFFKSEINVGDFEVHADKSYIYFNRKHYAVVDIVYDDNDTAIYKAECVRHTGHRHIKYETTFVVTSVAIGYSETLLIEI